MPLSKMENDISVNFLPCHQYD